MTSSSRPTTHALPSAVARVLAGRRRMSGPEEGACALAFGAIQAPSDMTNTRTSERSGERGRIRSWRCEGAELDTGNTEIVVRILEPRGDRWQRCAADPEHCGNRARLLRALSTRYLRSALRYRPITMSA